MQTLISPDDPSGSPDIQQHATLLYHEGLLVSERLSGNSNWPFTAATWPFLFIQSLTERPLLSTDTNRAVPKDISVWRAEDVGSAPAIRALQEMLGQPSLMCGRCFVMQRALVLGD